MSAALNQLLQPFITDEPLAYDAGEQVVNFG
jgi:hypothetical protein